MIAVAVVVFVGLRLTIQTYVIFEPCMEPNLYEGQRILVNKVVYNVHEPERGDVIILWPPFDVTYPFVKRIIGLPGETVEVKDGEVYINGVKLYEPYIKEPPIYTLKKITVPDNEYFVLGDNRNIAQDSHFGWTVPAEDIVGKAWITVWPPSMWGMVANYPFPEQVASAAGD